jgi:hypothetical protein
LFFFPFFWRGHTIRCFFRNSAVFPPPGAVPLAHFPYRTFPRTRGCLGIPTSPIGRRTSPRTGRRPTSPTGWRWRRPSSACFRGTRSCSRPTGWWPTRRCSGTSCATAGSWTLLRSTPATVVWFAPHPPHTPSPPRPRKRRPPWRRPPSQRKRRRSRNRWLPTGATSLVKPSRKEPPTNPARSTFAAAELPSTTRVRRALKA